MATVNAAEDEKELSAVRRSVIRGAPFGEKGWVKRTARLLGLESALRARGRPRNNDASNAKQTKKYLLPLFSLPGRILAAGGKGVRWTMALTMVRTAGAWMLAALAITALAAGADEGLPAAVPFGWPNALAEFRAAPTGNPGGALAGPWQATNPGSFDTNGFGIADGPVQVCGSGVLTNGRAAIAFEQWVKVGGGGAAGGVEPRLCVRAWDGKAWTPVGQDISLSPTGKPLSFAGSELPWPVNPTAGKALPYWHGSCRVLWGKREFWFGGFFTASALRIGAVGRADQLTMLWGTNKGLRVWRMKEGQWAETKTVEMQREPAEKSTAGVKIRTVEETLLTDVDASGQVYLCTAQQILTEKANTFSRAYPVRIARHSGAGETEPVTWTLNPLAMEGSPTTQTSSPQENGFGEPTSVMRMVMWSRGAFPLVGIEYRAARTAGEKGPMRVVWRYWRLVDGKWKLLWEGRDADRASDFGRPMGQRPDGYPVWWFRKGGQPNHGFSGHPYYAEWQTESGGGKFVEEKLPAFAPGSFTEVSGTPDIAWHSGQPVLAVTGVSRYPEDGTRTRQRLHTALWTRRDGRWVNAGGTPGPAFTRPFHGGHDGIASAQAVVSAQGEAILLWHNQLPIHGPDGTFAAAISLPQK